MKKELNKEELCLFMVAGLKNSVPRVKAVPKIATPSDWLKGEP